MRFAVVLALGLIGTIALRATVEFIAPDATQTIGAGNHAPAIALFAVGSAMGITALLMIRRRRAQSAPSL